MKSSRSEDCFLCGMGIFTGTHAYIFHEIFDLCLATFSFRFFLFHSFGGFTTQTRGERRRFCVLLGRRRPIRQGRFDTERNTWTEQGHNPHTHNTYCKHQLTFFLPDLTRKNRIIFYGAFFPVTDVIAINPAKINAYENARKIMPKVIMYTYEKLTSPQYFF